MQEITQNRRRKIKGSEDICKFYYFNSETQAQQWRPRILWQRTENL